MTAHGFDPLAIMKAVDEGAAKLEKAADTIANAVRDAAECEAAYDEAMEKELIRLYDSAKRAGERLPAEDVRTALAHEKVEAGVWAGHLMAKANLAALDKQMKGLSAAVSARQSLLRTGS